MLGLCHQFPFPLRVIFYNSIRLGRWLIDQWLFDMKMAPLGQVRSPSIIISGCSPSGQHLRQPAVVAKMTSGGWRRRRFNHGCCIHNWRQRGQSAADNCTALLVEAASATGGGATTTGAVASSLGAGGTTILHLLVYLHGFLTSRWRHSRSTVQRQID